METITIAHGSGGKLTHKLIKDLFMKYLGNDILDKCGDSALLKTDASSLAFTTDSFVVKPVFFPGGDIGKIAVCGTVNDLAVSGADPMFISAGFIIEEGLPLKDLEKIVVSMGEWAARAGVKIVSGDTKVVERGKADSVFINTSGIGFIPGDGLPGEENIRAGDKIIISGTLGDHGISVLSRREGIEFNSEIKSDCAPLNAMIRSVIDSSTGVVFMRDPTRGGLATTLNEITDSGKFGITVDEGTIPVAEAVRGACELFGLDPLYIANEGKVIIFARSGSEEKIIDTLKHDEYGKNASIIGEVTEDHPGRVHLRTKYGGERIIDMLSGEQLPRIC